MKRGTGQAPRRDSRNADGPDVVVVGNLTIDDVVNANGETTMASPGGNTLHTAAGARISGGTGRGGRPGRRRLPCGGSRAVARCGGRHDGTAPGRRADRAQLGHLRTGRAQELGVQDAPGAEPRGGPSPRGPAGRVDGPGRAVPRVVHVAAMPFSSAARIVEPRPSDAAGRS